MNSQQNNQELNSQLSEESKQDKNHSTLQIDDVYQEIKLTIGVTDHE